MRIVILVTELFPYGNGETFIENEIQYLARQFDRVLIYSAHAGRSTGREHRAIPDNAMVFPANTGKAISRCYFTCLKKKNTRHEITEFCRGKDFLHKIVSCFYFEQVVQQSSEYVTQFLDMNYVTQEDRVVVYSYWLSTIGMTALNIYDALIRRKIKANIVSRCHGYDLYSERAYLGYLPFQKFMLDRMEAIYPCSEQGSVYLKRRYPDVAGRISTAYLGVKDRFNGILPLLKENEFHFVSCSNVIPVKRVERIVDALAYIQNMKIRWTHFGDGELLENVKNSALKLSANIKVDFKGRVSNSNIYKFYHEHNVNLFVNVSSSEGLPVSIIEAISFGIPVIATDVGGTSEVVRDSENGFLLDENFEMVMLANLICRMEQMSPEAYRDMCQNSRKIYEDHFSAKQNYTSFCRKLTDLTIE